MEGTAGGNEKAFDTHTFSLSLSLKEACTYAYTSSQQASLSLFMYTYMYVCVFDIYQIYSTYLHTHTLKFAIDSLFDTSRHIL